MTVCGNRTDTPGSFTPCAAARPGGCACGQQVEAELEQQLEDA